MGIFRCERSRRQGHCPDRTGVKTQTQDAAAIFGLVDRGVLSVGMPADTNVVMNLEKIECVSILSMHLHFLCTYNCLG